MSKTIGILGGIGPESSAIFYERLITAFKDKFKPIGNTDFPRIIINSIPAVELTSGENQQKLNEYIDGLKFLEKESDFIVIVCNTAFNYLDRFSKEINKPILNITKIVQGLVGNNKILLLASPNSIDERVFGLSNIIELKSKQRQKIGEIINQYNSGNISNQEKFWLLSLIREYQTQVGVILIACTELSLMLGRWEDSKKIDTFDLLIQETLGKYGTISEN